MHYLHWIAGTILALAWFSRIVDAAFGMPSVADISTPEWDRHPLSACGSRRVSIIVPARNEEQDVESCLTSLLNLDYDNYEVIAVDDRSTDRTGEIMDRMRSHLSLKQREVGHPESRRGNPTLQVMHHRQLPCGWLGKAHAMWTGSNQATGDWLLFTDADVLFKPDSIRRALAYAEAERADHLVLFPEIITKTPGETMMIAFFQTMFVFGHRPWKVADPKAKDHIGVGAFNLIRRPAYDAVGTYERLRMEVLDDMRLGKIVKNAGFAQRNVFGGGLISIHWARGTAGVIDNLTKNFFAILSFQWWRTLLSAFGLAFLNLGPFLGLCLAQGWERLPYVIALLSMFAIYAGISRNSKIPPYYFLLHPVSSTLFTYILIRSMVHALRNDGIVWRGTKYPLEELKKGLV